MSDSATTQPRAHPLLLDSDEVPVAATAVRLLISDDAHQVRVHQLGREILGALQGSPEKTGTLTISLDPEQMKIMHSAVKLLFDDLQREQASQRKILRILNKLPDERTMRAIKIDAQAPPAEADPVVDDQAA